MLEATIDHLRSEVKDHQEAIRATTANIDGTIARWKEQLLKNDISNAKATSLVEAARSICGEVIQRYCGLAGFQSPPSGDKPNGKKQKSGNDGR